MTEEKGLLAACPFCGGEASDSDHVRYSRPLDHTWWADGSPVTEAFNVHCMACGATCRSGIIGGYQTKDEAIAAWNRRARPVAPASAVEALREALEPFALEASEYDDDGGDPDYRNAPDESSLEELNDLTVGALRKARKAWSAAGYALTAQAHPAGDDGERLREALEWYADQVGKCRKVTGEGEKARFALDKDGGERARAALATHPRPDEAQAQSGEPIAWVHRKGQDRELEWHRMGAGRLTAADKADGWTETPLYAHPAPASDAGEREAGLNANYAEGVRDLAGMPHVPAAIAAVLNDCADLIAALSTTGTSQDQGERG